MKIKDLNLSEYTYKRVCVYDENQTFYPVGKESLLLEKHGERSWLWSPKRTNSAG
jgi:hypothetical protein